MLNEICQAQKYKHHMIYIEMQNLKRPISLSESKIVVTRHTKFADLGGETNVIAGRISNLFSAG